jgi:hypothetical protein
MQATKAEKMMAAAAARAPESCTVVNRTFWSEPLFDFPSLAHKQTQYTNGVQSTVRYDLLYIQPCNQTVRRQRVVNKRLGYDSVHCRRLRLRSQSNENLLQSIAYTTREQIRVPVVHEAIMCVRAWMGSIRSSNYVCTSLPRIGFGSKTSS